MADTYYAWSPVDNGKKVIKLGGVVTEDDVGEDWDYLIESRAIRTQKYPADVGSSESPNDKWRRDMAALGALGEMPEPPAVVEEVKK